MAPILSKPRRPPPQTPKEVADLAAKQARPVLQAFLQLVQSTLVQTGAVADEVARFVKGLGSFSDKVVQNSVRFLEGYCCLDLKRWARGPEPKLQGSLPLLFVVMLLMMLYNAFVNAYMPAAGLAFNSPTSLLFHAFIFLVLASFAQVIRTDPGGIPQSAEWRTKGRPPPEMRERKHGCNEPRWCRKSEAYKPDRSHFCRIMNRGVLRMDHHCPWLGNTIGFRNHKFFYLFLLYTNAACSMLGLSILELLVHTTLPALTTFLLIGAEGLTLLLSVILGPFLAFHTWLLVRNMTTIEFCASMRSGNEEDDANDDLTSMYDVGVYNNICAVLGENPLEWFLPIGGAIGNGISFPLKQPLTRWSSAAGARAGQRTATKGSKPGATQGEAAASAASAAPEEDDGPEAAHPGIAKDVAESQEEEEEEEENDGEEEEDGEDQASSGLEAEGDDSAPADDGCGGFLVWRDAAEFTDDLRVGCESIEEEIEETLMGIAKLVLQCGGRTSRRGNPGPNNNGGSMAAWTRRAWRLMSKKPDGNRAAGTDGNISSASSTASGRSRGSVAEDFFSD